MVKTDYTRDYYADLELTQTADADEIKKQFRHLGITLPLLALFRLLSHPSFKVSP